MSLAPHETLSIAEMKVWWSQALTAAGIGFFTEDNVALLTDDFLLKCRPVDFVAPPKPRKPRSSKVSPDSSIRGAASYNHEFCDARLKLKGGIAGQCSRSSPGEGCLCKKHQAIADANNGMTHYGFFNQDRPDNYFGDVCQVICGWADQEKPEKKKNKSSKQRKCSHCGGVGHNKRSCPILKADSGAGVGLVEQEQPEQPEQTEEQEQKEQTEEPVEQEQKEQTEEPVEQEQQEQHVEAEGPVEQEQPVQEEVEEEVLEMDTSLDVIEQSPSSSIEFEYEGVPYLRSVDNQVTNEDQEVIGQWDGSKIVFTSMGEKLHQFEKAAL